MVALPRILTAALLIMLFVLPGCYTKSRRHLASDASLIEVGVSTRNDVLTYLGEPDIQRPLGDDRVEWVYVEEIPSGLQWAPIVGEYFEGKGYDKVFVVLEQDIVRSCTFRKFADDELDWADDFDWQESKSD